MNLLFYALLIIFATLGNIFVKSGINNLGKLDVSSAGFLPVVWKIFSNLRVIEGLVFYALGAVFYFILLSRVNLNVAASLAISIYVSVILVSVFYFKENIPLLSWIGIGLICLGIYLVSRHAM